MEPRRKEIELGSAFDVLPKPFAFGLLLNSLAQQLGKPEDEPQAA
jgi:hypothetical protein